MRMQMASLGLEAVLAPAIGGLAGHYLDEKYGFAPWAMVIGAVVGCLLSAKLIVMITRLQGKANEEKE